MSPKKCPFNLSLCLNDYLMSPKKCHFYLSLCLNDYHTKTSGTKKLQLKCLLRELIWFYLVLASIVLTNNFCKKKLKYKWRRHKVVNDYVL